MVWVEWAGCLRALERIRETSSHNKIEVGPPKLTRYEKARIVGARALQISMGAPVLLELEENTTDPIDIALLEFEKDAIPITVLRKLPSEKSAPAS